MFEEPKTNSVGQLYRSRLSKHRDTGKKKTTATELSKYIAITMDNLASCRVNAIYKNPLPILEPEIFTGDPIQYRGWIQLYDFLTEGRIPQSTDRFYFLIKYLDGEAKEAVKGFVELYGTDAYKRARQVLKERFGTDFVITEALRSKLEKWPNIHGKDNRGLRRYSDFLNCCQRGSKNIPDLGILNDMRELNKLANKLPKRLVDRWQQICIDSKYDKDRYPDFSEFVRFVQRESDQANDPLINYSENPIKMYEGFHQTIPKSPREVTSPANKSLEKKKQFKEFKHKPHPKKGRSKSHSPQRHDSVLRSDMTSQSKAYECGGSRSYDNRGLHSINNSETTQAISTSESPLLELQSQLEVMLKEKKLCQKELNEERRISKNINSIKESLNKENADLKKKLSDLQHEIISRELIISNNKIDHRKLQEENSALKRFCEDLSRELCTLMAFH
ncbi:hypothetical protein Ahia01_000470500 [Argonauta hians]